MVKINFKCIFAGLIILGIGFIILLPSIILTLAGSPIKGETDLGRLVVNELDDQSDNEVVANVAKNVNSSFNIIDSVPYILIIIGILIILSGFSIP